MRWPWSPSVPEQNDYSETPLPHSWRRRHWKVLTAVAAVVVLVVGGLWLSRLQPRNPCGDGLTPEGSECVGLDLNSSFLSLRGDKLSDLEQDIRQNNRKVSGSNYVTIVYLDDLAPNTFNDSVTLKDLRERIAGAITAQQAANGSGLAGSENKPQIKLLLANYGNGAQYYSQAVTKIKKYRDRDHIAAVTGIGQSLVKTRQAIADLSGGEIVTVGSISSADDLNEEPNGKVIPYFYRVVSTNTDEARAAESFIVNHRYNKVMLIQDKNSNDDYVKNIGDDVASGLVARNLQSYVEQYNSPDPSVGTVSRDTDIKDQIPDIRNAICSYRPNLIYFAGRGVDLRSFLNGLVADGGCPGYPQKPVAVLSGDDASSAADSPLPKWGGITFNVFYTAAATGDEWSKNLTDTVDRNDYNLFLNWFKRQHFHFDNLQNSLVNGHAMLTYDALITAAQAIRSDPPVARDPSSISTDPNGILDAFQKITCEYPVKGADGRIAFFPNTLVGPSGKASASQGDPIDKPVPIMQIQQDGTPSILQMTWADGGNSYVCGGGS